MSENAQNCATGRAALSAAAATRHHDSNVPNDLTEMLFFDNLVAIASFGERQLPAKVTTGSPSRSFQAGRTHCTQYPPTSAMSLLTLVSARARVHLKGARSDYRVERSRGFT